MQKSFKFALLSFQTERRDDSAKWCLMMFTSYINWLSSLFTSLCQKRYKTKLFPSYQPILDWQWAKAALQSYQFSVSYLRHLVNGQTQKRKHYFATSAGPQTCYLNHATSIMTAKQEWIHNIRAGMKYPPFLFYFCSTASMKVHPTSFFHRWNRFFLCILLLNLLAFFTRCWRFVNCRAQICSNKINYGVEIGVW